MDQTLPNWRDHQGLGTLVIFSDVGLTDYLRGLMTKFETQLFSWGNETEFKLYVLNVDRGVTFDPNLQSFNWAWVPEWVKTL